MLINIGNNENEEKIAITVIQNSENEDLYEYFIGDIKIGVLDKGVMEDNILMLQNTLDNDLSNQIKDAIDRLPREEIEEEGELAKAIDDYLKEFGEDDERAKEVALVDLDEEEKEENSEKQEEKDDDDEKIVKPSTVKDVNVKQTVDLGERANDMHDVRKWFGLPQDVVKIGVIESYQMSNLHNSEGKDYSNATTRYSLIAIGKNGEVRPLSEYIPELEQRDSVGNNPVEESYQVDDSGRVNKDANLTEYQFGSKVIQIDNKEMGRIEINIGEEARDSTKAMGVELRTENVTFATDTSSRSVIGEYEQNGEDTVEENIEEAERHPDPEEDKMDARDIDGDIETASHIHTGDEIVLEDGTIMTFSELARRYGFYNDGVPDSEHAKEVYTKKLTETPEKTPDEIIEELDYEYEDPRIQNGRDM